jgi:hypothetical protein
MRERVDAAMDHMADLIKDALLDGLTLKDDEAAPATPPLYLSPEQFVERMRPQFESTLRQVAEVLSTSPDESSEDTQEKTCELFSELWQDALALAAQMRLEPALTEELPEAELPQGEWARRYRLMVAEYGSDDEPR